MAKIYYSEPDDTEECICDCPYCSSPAVYNDSGVIICSNAQCSSNG